jgi:hypothetical protein
VLIDQRDTSKGESINSFFNKASFDAGEWNDNHPLNKRRLEKDWLWVLKRLLIKKYK